MLLVSTLPPTVHVILSAVSCLLVPQADTDDTDDKACTEAPQSHTMDIEYTT